MACPFFDVIATLDHCTSRYTAGSIHIESYFVLGIESEDRHTVTQTKLVNKVSRMVIVGIKIL